MSDSPSAYSYIALVARLESLAEALVTSTSIRRKLPQVQEPNDVVEDQAESSLQGATDTSDEDAEKSWNEIAVLLSRIADGLREKANRRPLVSTSLPSLLNTFIRLTLQLSPLASSSTASAVITNHSQIETVELPSVEKLAVAESAAAESNIQAGRVEWLIELEEMDMGQVAASVQKHEEVIKEIGRVAANLAIDDDSNRETINLYLYPMAATQLLHAYSTGLQTATLTSSAIGTLRALIGSTLNLVLGDVSAIKSYFLQPAVMDTLIALYEVLRSARTDSEVDASDLETLCEWLWKVIEAASGEEKASATSTPSLLNTLQASFEPFSGSSTSKSPSSSSFSPATTLSILNIICSTTERAFSDNPSQYAVLLESDSKLLRQLLAFVEHGMPPAVWLDLEDDDDELEEEEDTPIDASASSGKSTRKLRWEKQLGLAKASMLRLVIDACSELDMSQQSASWFLSEMERWLESHGRKRTGDGEVDEGRPDLIGCALLCFGNFARTERTATSLLLSSRPKPLLPLLRPLLRGSTSIQVQHALIGLLKNLAIPPVNKPILGKAGVIEGICDMGVWLEKRDMVGSVQGGAVGLVKHLCYGNAANSLKIANHLSLNTIDGPLHQLIALRSRTDDTALKCETSRIFVNVIRSLWLSASPESPPSEKVVTEAKKTMMNPDVVKAVVGLLAAGKDAGHAVLVNEGVVTLALLSREEAGLELVSKIYLDAPSESPTTYANLTCLLSLLHPTATINPLNPISTSRRFILSPEIKSNIFHLLRVLILTWKKDDQTAVARELVKNELVSVVGEGETGAVVADIKRLLEENLGDSERIGQ